MLYFSILSAGIIYIIGILIIILNGRNNLIMLIIALEIILLSLGLLSFQLSIILDDITGILITILLLPLAGSESAIFLSLIINYYPLRGTLQI
jgi:NADH:ubiquinone oxidoreductase subunit K